MYFSDIFLVESITQPIFEALLKYYKIVLLLFLLTLYQVVYSEAFVEISYVLMFCCDQIFLHKGTHLCLI